MQFLPIIDAYLASLSDDDIVGVCMNGDQCLVANAIKHAHPNYRYVTVTCWGTVYANDNVLEPENEEYEGYVSLFDHIGNDQESVSKKKFLESAEYWVHRALSQLFETIGQSLYNPGSRVRLGLVTEEE